MLVQARVVLAARASVAAAPHHVAGRDEHRRTSRAQPVACDAKAVASTVGALREPQASAYVRLGPGQP